MPSRVRTRRQFALLAAPTKRGKSGPLRISFASDIDESSSVSVAYAINRKVGNAVARNKVRRRLRTIMDSFSPQPSPGIYLIKCGFGTSSLSYDQLRHHLQQGLERAGVI